MLRLAPLMLIVLLVLPACSDDDTVVPGDDFNVVVNVADPDGDPVAGLTLALWNDSDLLQKRSPDKASCRIFWIQPLTARIRLTIQDIEGLTVRVLVDEELAGGERYVMWDGCDEDGIPQLSGRYTTRLQGFLPETGTLSFDGTVDVWLAVADFRDDQVVGTTDASGRIILEDMRLFPHLYERPAMTVYDENGESQGDLVLTAEMILALWDPDAGQYMRFPQQVTGTGDVLSLVWDPAVPVKTTRAAVPAARALDKFAEGPAPEWALKCFPNPFN